MAYTWNTFFFNMSHLLLENFITYFCLRLQRTFIKKKLVVLKKPTLLFGKKFPIFAFYLSFPDFSVCSAALKPTKFNSAHLWKGRRFFLLICRDNWDWWKRQQCVYLSLLSSLSFVLALEMDTSVRPSF